MVYLECPDLSENTNVSFFTNFNNESFRFNFQWKDDCILSIFDNNGQPVRTGVYLKNKRLIKNDNRVLPNFLFIHKDGLSLEPTQETIKDYILYANTSE